jgi:hypothetical protein
MNLTPLSIVFADIPKGYRDKYPFSHGERLLFLGEITNMPGHCIVVNFKGRVMWGYHTDNFRLPTESEL